MGRAATPCSISASRAREGETFSETSEASGGASVGVGHAQTVSLVENTIAFHSNGTATQTSSVGMSGGKFAGYGGGAGRSRYRLGGYLLEMRFEDGRVERHSYCRMGPGYVAIDGASRFSPK